jgi:hypothetical protein
MCFCLLTKLGANPCPLDRQFLESFVVKDELSRRRSGISLQEFNRVEDEKRFVAVFAFLGLYLCETLDDVAGQWRTIDRLSRSKLQRYDSGPVLVAVSFVDLFVPFIAVVLVIVLVFSDVALSSWVTNEVTPDVRDPLHVKV